jgi:hypothetical protein
LVEEQRLVVDAIAALERLKESAESVNGPSAEHRRR